MPTRHWILYSLLSIALFLGGFFIFWESPSPAPTVTTPTVPASPWPVFSEQSDGLATTCPQVVESYRWDEGAEQMYSFYLETEVSVNPNLLVSQDDETAPIPMQQTQLTVEGTLNFRVFEKRGDIIYAGFQLAPVKLKSFDRELKEEKLIRLYQSFMLVHFSESGRLLKIEPPPSLSVEDAQVVSGLITNLQIILPEADEVVSSFEWEQGERDTIGDYFADYQADPKYCGFISKQKQNYFSIESLAFKEVHPAFVNLEGEVVTSDYQAVVEASDSWLSTISGKESLRLQLNDQLLSEASMTLKVELSLFNPDRELEIWNTSSELEALLSHFEKSTLQQAIPPTLSSVRE